MLLKVKVVPGARRSEIVGRYDDGIKVRVAAPPEDGRANRALLELLARALGAPANAVRLVRGASSAHKVVEVPADSLDEVRARLGV